MLSIVPGCLELTRGPSHVKCTHSVDLVARRLQRIRVWDTNLLADVSSGLARKYSPRPTNLPAYLR